MSAFIVLALVAAAGAGLFAGGYRLMTSPAVWASVAGALADVLLPAMVDAFTVALARKPPEAEARDHETERQGGNTAPTAHGHGGENR